MVEIMESPMVQTSGFLEFIKESDYQLISKENQDLKIDKKS